MSMTFQAAIREYNEMTKRLMKDFGSYALAMGENNVDEMDKLHAKVAQRMERYQKAAEAIRMSGDQEEHAKIKDYFELISDEFATMCFEQRKRGKEADGAAEIRSHIPEQI